jgi:glyoxylase-like metal-dependent hydrolase (beta-lactamase superfamily II)
MHVATLSLGPIETNCFIVWNDVREALVIDPGYAGETILDFVKERDLKVVAYPLTHGHMDHVSAVAHVYRERPAPVGLHPADALWAFTPANAMPPLFGTPEAPAAIERSYAEGQVWEDAGLRYRVLETPGHTPGSVTFYFEEEGAVFSGDVLFQGSVGRTDLPGGDARTLGNSLRRLAELPDEVTVYCGHGPATTLGEEKRTNFFMRQLG